MRLEAFLDALESAYGGDHPLPDYIQRAVIMHALNKNYGMYNQYSQLERNYILSEGYALQLGIVGNLDPDYIPEKSMKQKGDRHYAIVQYVIGGLDASGDLIVDRGGIGIRLTDIEQIADYLSQVSEEWRGQVMPAHVRQARQVVKSELKGEAHEEE